VQGNSTLPVITAVDISLNPVYIKNPNNLGINPITESAVIIEGGADRVDISNEAVSLSLFKPISMNLVGGYEQIGAIQFAGINSVGTTVRYGSVRGVCTNPTSGATKGRLEFNVIDNLTHSVRMEIDASANVIRTDGGSRFSDRGYKLYPDGVKITTAGVITKETTPTLVPESAFTIPTGLDGYYSYSAYIFLAGVGDVSGANDYIDTLLDISGVGAITGTEVISTIVELAGVNTVRLSVCGLIPQRLTEGQTVRLFHLESAEAGFTFTNGSIQVNYMYHGDTSLA
jgi:hypothetical protein